MSSESAGLSYSAYSPRPVRVVGNKILTRWKRPVRLLCELLLLVIPILAISAALQARRASAGTQLVGPIVPTFHYGMLEGMAIAMIVGLVGAAAAVGIRSLIGEARRRPQLETQRSARSLRRAPSSDFWRAQEDERKQISRELHDSVGQVLTAAGLQLRSLKASMPPSEVDERLSEACRLNAEALRLVRDLAMTLRPALLDDVNLVAALEWQARQISRQSGIAIRVDASGELEALTEGQRTCIYRTVQEALTNCVRHAHATNVRIAVRSSVDAVEVTVEDDGIGIDPDNHSRNSLGLLGMRERVAGVNGTISIARRRGGGTALSFRIPLGERVPA
jgi:signal transduction histidine kinase